METVERIRRYINSTDSVPNYQMKFSEILALAQIAKDTPCDAICLAFEYGRAKGYRFATKRQNCTSTK